MVVCHSESMFIITQIEFKLICGQKVFETYLGSECMGMLARQLHPNSQFTAMSQLGTMQLKVTVTDMGISATFF